jgi:hypothetical protein
LKWRCWRSSVHGSQSRDRHDNCAFGTGAKVHRIRRRTTRPIDIPAIPLDLRRLPLRPASSLADGISARPGRQEVDFALILDAPDKDAIVQLAIGKEITEILYDRPQGWFAYLEQRAKLGYPNPSEVDRIAEAKATRDVLVHNRGVANKIYESKAAALARFKPGQRIDIPEPYHREIWELLRKVVRDVSDAALAKLP